MEFTGQIAEQLLITSVERLVDFDEQSFFLELGDRGTDDGLCRCRHFVFYFGNGFERVLRNGRTRFYAVAATNQHGWCRGGCIPNQHPVQLQGHHPTMGCYPYPIPTDDK